MDKAKIIKPVSLLLLKTYARRAENTCFDVFSPCFEEMEAELGFTCPRDELQYGGRECRLHV